MLPIRKFVIALFLLSVMPVTILLIIVKVLSSSQKANTEIVELVITPTPFGKTPVVDDTNPYIRYEIPLKLFAPVNGATVFAPFVTVKGQTKAYAQLSVNEASSAADLNGNFVIPISLGKGRNPVIVTAIDERGRRSVMEIAVIFDDSQILTFPSPFASPSAFATQ